MYQVAVTGDANPDSYQLLLSSSWSGLAETQIVAIWTGDASHGKLYRFLCDDMPSLVVVLQPLPDDSDSCTMAP